MATGRFNNLADHLRSWGLDVVEVDGWKTRGRPFTDIDDVKVVVCHHTGSKLSHTKDLPTFNVLKDGRDDLPGPLCAVGLGYSGKVYVFASGKANHAGSGHWAGIFVGNDHSLGIEAESPGDGTWTPEQRRVYPILSAALVDLIDSDAHHVCAHRESAEPHGRKNDPVGIDMDVHRAQVATILQQHRAPKPKPPARVIKEIDMFIITSPGHTSVLITANSDKASKQKFIRRGLTASELKLYSKSIPVTPLTDAEYSSYTNANVSITV